MGIWIFICKLLLIHVIASAKFKILNFKIKFQCLAQTFNMKHNFSILYFSQCIDWGIRNILQLVILLVHKSCISEGKHDKELTENCYLYTLYSESVSKSTLLERKTLPVVALILK